MSKTRRQFQKQLAHIRAIDPGSIVHPDKRFELSIKDLGDKSVFHLNNKTYLVLEIGTYRETDDNYKKTYDWTGYELKTVCLETGETHNLEWEEDDEVEVSLTIGETRFSDLQYDDGEAIAQDSDDLDEIAEKKWEVVCSNKTFYYKDDYAATYSKGNGTKTEKVYFYDFETEDGEQLTIEVWIQDSGKEDFQVFQSRRVPPEEIEVIAISSAVG